ncbi:MAG: hypothetical protein ACRC54_07850 [Fusobacteriaceae bacterium]
MMFKILLYLFLAITTFSKDLIIQGDSTNRKLLKNYIEKKYELKDINIVFEKNESSEIIGTIEILKYNYKETAGTFRRMISYGEQVQIEKTAVYDYKFKGEVFAYFDSESKKIPYIWQEETRGNYFINGEDILYDENLQYIFEKFLKNQLISDLKIKEIKVQEIEKPGKDITRVTNNILLIFLFGIIIMVFFLSKSVRKGYGDSFKGE